jgi:hypothetical protein
MQQSFVTAANPAFLGYVFTCLVLDFNLVTLWVSSGALRAKGGVAINPEDGNRYGAPVSEWTRQPLRDSCARIATSRPQFNLANHCFCHLATRDLGPYCGRLDVLLTSLIPLRKFAYSCIGTERGCRRGNPLRQIIELDLD